MKCYVFTQKSVKNQPIQARRRWMALNRIASFATDHISNHFATQLYVLQCALKYVESGIEN